MHEDDIYEVNDAVEHLDRRRRCVQSIIVSLTAVVVVAVLIGGAIYGVQGQSFPRVYVSWIERLLLSLPVLILAGIAINVLQSRHIGGIITRALRRGESPPLLRVGDRLGSFEVLVAEPGRLHLAQARRITLRSVSRVLAVILAFVTLGFLITLPLRNWSPRMALEVGASLVSAFGFAAFAMRPVVLQWLVEGERYNLVLGTLRYGFRREALDVPIVQARWFTYEPPHLILGRRWFNRFVEETDGTEEPSPVRIANIGRGQIAQWRANRVIRSIFHVCDVDVSPIYSPKDRIWTLSRGTDDPDEAVPSVD